MRRALLPALLLAATPALAQQHPNEILPGVYLPDGVELGPRLSDDLNGDGVDDTAFITSGQDARVLTVLLSAKDKGDAFYRSEELVLEPSQFGAGTLTLDGDVLTFEDLTGGTTSVASTRRFRYDGRGKRMRLIGLDARVYSRTFAHDGFEMSWNLLTGAATTRELKLGGGGDGTGYQTGRQRSFKRQVRAQWLSDAPDPATVLEEMRDG